MGCKISSSLWRHHFGRQFGFKKLLLSLNDWHISMFNAPKLEKKKLSKVLTEGYVVKRTKSGNVFC